MEKIKVKEMVANAIEKLDQPSGRQVWEDNKIEFIEAARELYKLGYSAKQISEGLGVNYSFASECYRSFRRKSKEGFRNDSRMVTA